MEHRAGRDGLTLASHASLGVSERPLVSLVVGIVMGTVAVGTAVYRLATAEQPIPLRSPDNYDRYCWPKEYFLRSNALALELTLAFVPVPAGGKVVDEGGRLLLEIFGHVVGASLTDAYLEFLSDELDRQYGPDAQGYEI